MKMIMIMIMMKLHKNEILSQGQLHIGRTESANELQNLIFLGELTFRFLPCQIM